MDIKILVEQMTELFIIIFLGYFVYKIKIVDEHFVKKFSKLVLDVTLPAMLLSSVFELDQRQATSDVLISIAVACALFYAILPAFGYLLAKIVRAKKEQTGIYTFMNTYSNVGFMGFPVISALCGATGLFYAAIFNLIFNIAIYSMGIWMLNRGRDNAVKLDPKLLLTPGTIVPLAALGIYFADIHLPGIITETVSLTGSITSPAAMLIIGCSLARMDIRSVFTEWRLYPWTILKQIVMPLLLWFVFVLVIKNRLVLTVTYILSAMPVGNSAVLFAANYDGDTELAAKGVFITTLFSLITVPIVVMLVM